MTEFIYNNIKNTNSGHILFELNYGYHPCISFADEVDPQSKFCLANKLAKELRDLMLIFE